MLRSTKNLKDSARMMRMVFGLGLLAIALFGLNDLTRAIAIILATYSIITGIVGYCPVTELLEGSNRATSRSPKKHRK